MSAFRSSPTRQGRRLAALAGLTAGLLVPATVMTAAPNAVATPRVTTASSPTDPVLQREADESPVVVRVEVHDTAELDRLVATGVDLDHGVEQEGDHLEVKAVVTPSEMAVLEGLGFTMGEVLWTEDDARRALDERRATLSEARRANRAFAQRATSPEVSDVRIIRADYYTSFGVGVLSVEAKWVGGSSVSTPLVVELDSGPGTEIGSGGTRNINRFVDAGVYLYHRGASAVPTVDGAPVRPDRVRITSPSGDVVEARVSDWLPTEDEDPFKGPGYQEDFVGSYLDPSQLYDRIAGLAAQYPDLAELVELPHQTHGYRRTAQTLLDPPGNRLVLRSDGRPAGEVTYIARSGSVGAVPAGGIPETSTSLEAVEAAANPTYENATPDQGCGPVGGFTTGAIALVTRGECTFTEKAVNAQAAGASAVVIVNNVAGGAQSPGNVAASVTIPVVGISQADGATVSALTAPSGRLLPATAVSNDQRVGVDSRAWGHEGGEDISIQVVDPGAADEDLTVTVAGKSVQVSSATGADGERTSTAADVVAALNAHPRASELIEAYTYRGSEGTGIVQPTRLLGLDDFLSAPDYVSREPHTVYALRIGTAPEGDKPGVFAYAQEHAREWVPPLVTVEAAERLLANYAAHPPTQDLVDNLEVWIMPSVNPDGGHYSFYDFASQRRNLNRVCTSEGSYDLGARNSWGVDVNRNYDAYSLFDGYDGASTSCTSDVFAGPAELSESESKNVDFVAGKPNMRFAMNMHSSGNYFMWSPGAYKLPGRVSAPRPTLEEESYFWQASTRILKAIKYYRGLSVTPARTGVTSDVLYSAAGNSGDMNWYKHGLYAWNFEVGTSFQPPFANEDPKGPSAHAEAMEYANGLVELMRVARDLETDAAAPSSSVSVTDSATEGQVNVTFDVDESAEIRYTVDGSAPTSDNEAVRIYAPNGVREGGELLTLDEGTTLFWYAVDTAGNSERGYDPDDLDDRSYRKWIADAAFDGSAAASEVTVALDTARVRAGSGEVEARVSVVADNPFGLSPSGAVMLTVGGETLVVDLDDSGEGVASLGPFLEAGTLTVAGEYGGDDVAAPATADPVTITVARAASTVRVVRQTPKVVRVSGPAARTRAVLRIRTSVTGLTATGRVQVKRGGRPVASGRLDAGKVDVRLPRFKKAGARKVRVVYLGSDDVAASTTTWTVRVRR